MVEPVALADFFASFFSGAMIILVAALYAGLYAWQKIAGGRFLKYWQATAFAGLLVFVAIFAHVNHLNGEWRFLSALMLVGYWCMPRIIWRLCAATHANEDHP